MGVTLCTLTFPLCIGPLVITGTLDEVGGDVELTFQSTINRASYECILITGDTDTPTLHPCECVMLVTVCWL